MASRTPTLTDGSNTVLVGFGSWSSTAIQSIVIDHWQMSVRSQVGTNSRSRPRRAHVSHVTLTCCPSMTSFSTYATRSRMDEIAPASGPSLFAVPSRFR